MDKIKFMQKRLKKYIDEKEQGTKTATDTKSTGLLSRKFGDTKGEEKGTGKKNNEKILADYIIQIRKFKEEVMSGKAK